MYENPLYDKMKRPEESEEKACAEMGAFKRKATSRSASDLQVLRMIAKLG